MRKNLKTILVSALGALALAFTGGAVATANLTAEAAEVPQLYLTATNLSLGDNIKIIFGVETENVDAANVKVLVWKDPQLEYRYENLGEVGIEVDYSGTSIDATNPNTGEVHHLNYYYYSGLAIREMTQEVYACAYTEIDGVAYYSKVKKYSILEYAYKKLGKMEAAASENEKLHKVINAMLAFGESMEEYNREGDVSVSYQDYVYNRIANATFEDGFDYDFLKAGNTPIVTPDTGYNLSEDAPAERYTVSNDVIRLNVPNEKLIDETSFVPLAVSELKYEYIAATDSYKVLGVDEDNFTGTELTIPATHKDGKPVTVIGANAFEGKSLTSVTIFANGVQTIEDSAFANNPGLTSVSIPEGVTSIGANAFASCALETVSLSKTVSNVEAGAFADNQGLTSISVDANNTYYQTINGDLYSKDNKTLYQYAIGKVDTVFTVDAKVTTIADYAFENSNLTSIALHNGITSIGKGAFQGCASLTSMILPEGLDKIDQYTFSGCTELTWVYVPTSILNVLPYAFDGCASLTNLYYDGPQDGYMEGEEYVQGWSDIFVRANNAAFENATTYFYGEKDYYITTVGTSETLDEKVSVETKDSARLDAMVYISKDGKFIISSTDVLKTLKCYIRFAATLNVYASVDGINWSAPIATWTTTAAPAYYTASVNNYSYKYFKVECTSSTREIWLMDFTLGMYSA